MPVCHVRIAKRKDLWFFFLVSPGKPFQVIPRKPELNDKGSNLRVALQQSHMLRMTLSPMDGQKDVRLALTRSLLDSDAYLETVWNEAEVTKGNVGWNPISVPIPSVAVVDESPKPDDFRALLFQLGTKGDGKQLDHSFVLADGPPIQYTLRLLRDRRLRPDVVDTTVP